MGLRCFLVTIFFRRLLRGRMIEMLTINWCGDVQAEETVQQIGLECVAKTIKLSEIDWKKSRENRAREIFLDDAHKESIKKSMEDRCTIPMIVVRLVDGRYVIVSGNHRGNAAKELLGTGGEIPCYVVECSDASFDVLATLSNLKNGKPISFEERINKAISYVQVYGYTLAKASELLGVGKNQIADRIKAFELACKMEIDIKPGMQTSIAKIPSDQAKLDSVCKAYGELFKSRRNGVSNSEMADIVKQVGDAKSEAEMIAKIETFTKQPKKLISDANAPRTNLIRAMKCFSTAIDKATKAKTTFADLDKQERKEVDELWKAIAKIMSSFQ